MAEVDSDTNETNTSTNTTTLEVLLECIRRKSNTIVTARACDAVIGLETGATAAVNMAQIILGCVDWVQMRELRKALISLVYRLSKEGQFVRSFLALVEVCQWSLNFRIQFLSASDLLIIIQETESLQVTATRQTQLLLSLLSELVIGNCTILQNKTDFHVLYKSLGRTLDSIATGSTEATTSRPVLQLLAKATPTPMLPSNNL